MHTYQRELPEDQQQGLWSKKQAMLNPTNVSYIVQNC